jgi:pimeloyl-ACP methyl ester carboxylesterase
MLLVYGLTGAGVYGAMHWFATRVVYQGSKSVPDLSTADGVALEDVWLRTRDGVKIHGWQARAEGARLATLFLHGNAGNIGHRVPRIKQIVAAGSDVLIIDYRGYGHSQGRPTEHGLSVDAHAAYEYLAALGKPIVLHGESLGTAVAVELATRRPAAGLVLEAPFTSLRGVAGHVLPVLGPLLLWGFDSKSRIAGVHAPLLVIHGDRDDTVPCSLGKELYDAAPGPKSLWTVPGAGHNNILEAAGPEYAERLRRFYSGIAPRSGA